jgi:SH3 domain-containing YSC84-like protein 1
MKHRVLTLLFAIVLAAPLSSLADTDTDKTKTDTQTQTNQDQIKNPDDPKRIAKSAEVMREFANMKEGAPRGLVEKAAAIVVIPDLVKAGFGVGGKHGEGLLSIKQGDNWSQPVPVKLTGGSIGWQAGVSSTDLVLLFMNDRDAKEILDGEFALGGDANVAAGPLGRQGSAGTDAHFDAPVYSYSRSKGLFAGISIDGSKLYSDKDAIARMYGGSTKAQEIAAKPSTMGSPGEELIAAIKQFVSGTTTPETGATDASSNNVGKK